MQQRVEVISRNRIFPKATPIRSDHYPLQVNVRDRGREVAVIDVEGELDIYTSPRFRTTLLEVLNQGYDQVVVNLDHLRYIDSSGLSAILSGLKRVREDGHGRMDVVCPTPAVRRVFEITRLHRVINLFESERQALDAARP